MATSTNLHRHIIALDAAFRTAGLTVSLHGDASSYRAAVAQIPGYSLTSPLDERFSALDGTMIWIGVENAKRQLVAVECGRLVEAPAERGGLNAIFNDQVFGRVLPVLTRLPTRQLAGRLGYLGGAWVHPDLRGRGIMSLCVRLTIAHLVRLYDVDAVFGFVRPKHVGLALAHDGYGFMAAEVVDLMYLPGAAAPETLCMVSTERAVIDERFSEDREYQLRPPRRLQRNVKSRSKSRH